MRRESMSSRSVASDTDKTGREAGPNIDIHKSQCVVSLPARRRRAEAPVIPTRSVLRLDREADQAGWKDLLLPRGWMLLVRTASQARIIETIKSCS